MPGAYTKATDLLGPPPSGYEYIRIANDILLMAMGTRLIAGAVADLASL